MNITVVGLGETGVTIAALLIERYDHMELNIMDPAEWVKGRLLDLRHAATMKGTQVTWNDPSAFENANYVFFCAGVRNAKGEDRLSIVQENKELIKLIFESSNFQHNPLVIVVTNPVELIATWLFELKANQLRVLGTGTYLDTERWKYILSRESGIRPKLIQTMVVGEHGNSMVVLESQTSIHQQPIHGCFSPKKLAELKMELKSSASVIRETEEATKFGVAQCAVEIIRFIDSDQEVVIPLSRELLLHERNMLGLDSAIFASFPTALGRGEFKPVPLPNLPENEWRELQDSCKLLQHVYQKVSNQQVQ
jgi:L-lactate dehydrogenase